MKNKIIELFNIDELDNDNDAYFTNERQISLAKEALSILDDVNKGVENEMPVDLIEIDIKRIWTKLGEILGENYDCSGRRGSAASAAYISGSRQR